VFEIKACQHRTVWQCYERIGTFNVMKLCVTSLHSLFMCVISVRSNGVATASLDKVTTYMVQERAVQSCIDYITDAGLNILSVAYSQHPCRPAFEE
jgi:hypothetical protein